MEFDDNSSWFDSSLGSSKKSDSPRLVVNDNDVFQIGKRRFRVAAMTALGTLPNTVGPDNVRFRHQQLLMTRKRDFVLTHGSWNEGRPGLEAWLIDGDAARDWLTAPHDVHLTVAGQKFLNGH